MSTQSEMFLTNVGKSSQQELLLDYEDYLITRGLSQWSLDDKRLQNVRTALREKMDRRFMLEKAKKWSDETLANVAITLVHQCDRMLAGLLEYQKQQFLEKGGIKEQMTKARLEARKNQSPQSPQSSQSPLNELTIPSCPKCGKPMVRRTQKRGNQPGSQFWGCSTYPECKGIRSIDPSPLNNRSNQSPQSPQSPQNNQYPQSPQSPLNNRSNQSPQSPQSPLNNRSNQSPQSPESPQSPLNEQ